MHDFNQINILQEVEGSGYAYFSSYWAQILVCVSYVYYSVDLTLQQFVKSLLHSGKTIIYYPCNFNYSTLFSNRMVQTIKLKYAVYYNHAIFNSKTKKYETNGCTYNSLSEAKTNRWKCEKCQYQIGTYNKLVLHKNQYHSYWSIRLVADT